MVFNTICLHQHIALAAKQKVQPMIAAGAHLETINVVVTRSKLLPASAGH